MGEAALAKTSLADYLELEGKSKTRHEYLAGWVIAMAGASPQHEDIVGNTFHFLKSKLGKGCKPYLSNLRVYLEESYAYLYPDLSVGCGDLLFTDDKPPALKNPTLIVEVLSDSTEYYDQNDKLEYYKSCRSIKEILFIHQRKPRLVVYRKRNQGWVHEALSDPSKTLLLESVQLLVGFSDVYDETYLAAANLLSS